MTQDEIIEMTRQAGGFAATPKFLETFAKLVAAKERERASKVASKAILNAVENERELCAKVCDALESNDADFDSHHWNQATQRCGYAIRARGEA